MDIPYFPGMGKQEFQINDMVLIPRQGIARITGRERIEAGGMTSEFFNTEFIPGLLISTLEKTQPTIRVNVKHAAQRFISLPGADEFDAAYKIALSEPKSIAGIWQTVHKVNSEKLGTGNLRCIAEVYRDTKSDSASDSTKDMNDQALRTLKILYAASHGVDLPEASMKTDAVLKPAPEIVEKAPQKAEKQTSVPIAPSMMNVFKVQASSSEPLELIVAMKLLSPEDMKTLKTKPGITTLNDAFKMVSHSSWPEAAAKLSLNPEQTDQLQNSVMLAAQKMAAYIK